MTADVDPLEWDELPDMMTVDEARRFLRSSDASVRSFAREHGIYCKISGNARIPKRGLAMALGFVEESGDSDESEAEVIDFPEAANQ